MPYRLLAPEDGRARPPEPAYVAVPEYAATPNGERPKAIRASIVRLRERLATVDAATTVEALGAVSW